MSSSLKNLFVTCCLLLATVAPSAQAAPDVGALFDTDSAAGVLSTAPTAPGYDPHHILVSFVPGLSLDERARIHAHVGGTVVNTLQSVDLDVVAISDRTEAPEAVTRYSQMAGVRYAGLNEYLISLSDSGQESRLPNDPDFDQQWHLHNTGQTISDYPVELQPDADIDAAEGWALLQQIADRKKTRVAIIDSGFSLRCGVVGAFCGSDSDSWVMDNPDLDDVTVAACAGATKKIGYVEEGNCTPDTNGHGSFLAGIIAAETNNNELIAGIAADVELALFRFFDKDSPTHADYFAGLAWATDPAGGAADIITLSIATPDCAENPIERELLEDAVESGIFIVAAAGNMTCASEGKLSYGLTPGSAPVYPSAYEFVMSVGGTNGRGEVWQTDNDPNYGTTCNGTVDILAPAEGILTTDQAIWAPTDAVTGWGYIYRVSGTSFAAPQVAGVAAELLAVTSWSREVRVERLRAALLASATDVASHPGRDPADCADLGQVNLAGAVMAARSE